MIIIALLQNKQNGHKTHIEQNAHSNNTQNGHKTQIEIMALK